MVVRPAAAKRPNTTSLKREANRPAQQPKQTEHSRSFNNTSRELQPRAFGGNGAPPLRTPNDLVNSMPGATYKNLGSATGQPPNLINKLSNYGDNTSVRESVLRQANNRADNFSLNDSYASSVNSKGKNTDLTSSYIGNVQNTGDNLKLGGAHLPGKYGNVTNQGDNAQIRGSYENKTTVNNLNTTGNNTHISDTEAGTINARGNNTKIDNSVAKSLSATGNNANITNTVTEDLNTKGNDTKTFFSAANKMNNEGKNSLIGYSSAKEFSHKGDGLYMTNSNIDESRIASNNANMHNINADRIVTQGNNGVLNNINADKLDHSGTNTNLNNSRINNLIQRGDGFQSSHSAFGNAQLNSNNANLRDTTINKDLDVTGHNNTITGSGSDQKNTLRLLGDNTSVKGSKLFANDYENPFNLGGGDDVVDIYSGQNSSYSFDGGEGNDRMWLPGSSSDWSHAPIYGQGANPTYSWNPSSDAVVRHTNFEDLRYGN